MLRKFRSGLCVRGRFLQGVMYGYQVHKRSITEQVRALLKGYHQGKLGGAGGFYLDILLRWLLGFPLQAVKVSGDIFNLLWRKGVLKGRHSGSGKNRARVFSESFQKAERATVANCGQVGASSSAFAVHNMADGAVRIIKFRCFIAVGYFCSQGRQVSNQCV